MPPDPLLRASRSLSERLANGTTRRSFLARTAALLLGATGGGSALAAGPPFVGKPGGTSRMDSWFGFCGHTWTTGSCRGPAALPRVDAHGYPLRPADGHAIDNLGRPVDARGRPVDALGERLTAPDGSPLPPAPRTRLCEDWVPDAHGVDAVLQGSWYRCCKGQIRRLWDCCSTSPTRVNGDASLTGYCRAGRRVFCVLYHETGVPC